MGTTIQDILDMLVDTGCELKVWEESTQAERDYNEDEDSDKEINSFEFYHNKEKDYIVFNID